MNKSTATLEELGWRQFSIVIGVDFPGLRKSVGNFQNDDIFIILPYSCAVVQMDFTKEPYVELFRVQKTESKNKGLQFGRSPRELQIEIQYEDSTFFANGFIHDRFFIDHAFLVDQCPNSDLKLNERECGIVKSWFAKRYIRSAFPTEFNKRAWPALKKLRDILKSDSNLDDLLGVYLVIDPKEQELTDPSEPYDVEVDFLVKESGMFNDGIKSILDIFKSELNKCVGISLFRADVRSETAVLLSEYRDLIRLDDYDFISHRDDHDDPVTI